MVIFFWRDFAAEGEGIKSQVQIRAEIDHHLKEKTRVETVIPQNIVIGPFFVNTDLVRLALGRKHKDVAQALLKYLVDSLRKETEQVIILVFVCVFKKLNEFCANKEVLFNNLDQIQCRHSFLCESS